MYISTLSLTLVLQRCGWPKPYPACFTPPGKDLVPIAWEDTKAGLDGYGMPCLQQGSIPGPSSLYIIAIPTGKVKGVPVQVTKSNSGSRSKVLLILKLRTGWKWLNSRTGRFCEQEVNH